MTQVPYSETITICLDDSPAVAYSTTDEHGRAGWRFRVRDDVAADPELARGMLLSLLDDARTWYQHNYNDPPPPLDLDIARANTFTLNEFDNPAAVYVVRGPDGKPDWQIRISAALAIDREVVKQLLLELNERCTNWFGQVYGFGEEE